MNLEVGSGVVVAAAVSDGRLDVLQQVAHVGFVQRHVLVQDFQRRRLLGRRFGRVGRPRPVTARRRRDRGRGGRRRRDGVVAGDDGRHLGGVGQVEPRLGRGREQRDEGGDGDDVDDERGDDEVAPDEGAAAWERAPPGRHGDQPAGTCLALTAAAPSSLPDPSHQPQRDLQGANTALVIHLRTHNKQGCCPRVSVL